jgi:membrane protein CcdC involved in cytochrome C biogenesis
MPPVVLATSLAGAAAVMAWRIRETTRPVTVKKIVIPPLAMSTGLAMFLFPPARIPLSWALLAFSLGAAVLSYPLIKTSTLQRQGDVVMLQRSRAFLAILVGLVGVRLLARAWVEDHVSTMQTGGIFFLLAFGMIVRWRVWMLLAYRRVATGA